MTDPKLTLENINVDLIDKNKWNPNEMDDTTFNRLVVELEETGFIDPIQVVPTDDGRYVILGGEHRWQAAKVLGWESIPCIILTDEKWKENDLCKFVTVRLNVLHGKTNAEKFMSIYNEMLDKYGEDSLKDLFAYTDSDAWDKLTGSVKEALKASGLPAEMIEEYAKTVEEVKTVDDLSNILNRLFTKHGDTLKYNFMVFAWGGKDHVYVKCDDKLWKQVNGLMKASKGNEVTMSSAISVLFDAADSLDYGKLEKVDMDEGQRAERERAEKAQVDSGDSWQEEIVEEANGG